MLPGITALRHKSFRTLWYGQAISQMGDSMYFLVFLFIAKKASNDSGVVGMVAALQAIPYVIFSPYAGQLADRLDRRLIMVVADWGSAVIAALLMLYALYDPIPPVPVIAAAGFLMSTSAAFFMPARSAAIPRLIPEEELLDANGIVLSTQQLISMIGLGISALGLGVIYELAPGLFLPIGAGVNALTFILSALFIVRLPKITPMDETDQELPKSDILGGLRAILANRLTRVGLPISFIFTFFVSAFFIVYLEANERWYGGKFTTLAWLEVSFSGAMVVGSALLNKYRVVRPGLAYGFSMAVVGVMIGLMAYGQNYALMISLNIVCGLVIPFAWIPFSTYLQAAFPDHLRGRVNSVWSMVHMGVQPASVGLGGLLLQRTGIVVMFIVMGAGMTGAALAGLLFRGFREEKIPDYDPLPLHEPEADSGIPDSE